MTYTLLHILKNGGAAGVFPEGSRSEQRLMGPWKPGALRAAFATEATILPITFVTAGEFWPRGRWRPRFFRKHHMVIHRPLTYAEYMAAMPEGTHQITLRNGDAPPYTTTVTITPGQPVTVKHKF